MKKIVVFTGAGISAESGIPTFRDKLDGLWEKYDTDIVASEEGWSSHKEEVLEFHNELRKQIYDCQPNAAHKALKDLEKHGMVTIITQNIDDMHERAKSSNIIHLHGELLKCRSTVDYSLSYDCRGSINIGDKCEKGSQLKPDTVLFGEMPRNVDEGYTALSNADYIIIVGCSFQIGYTLTMFHNVKHNAKVYFVDPEPVKYLDAYGLDLRYIEESATVGVREVVDKIIGEIEANELNEAHPTFEQPKTSLTTDPSDPDLGRGSDSEKVPQNKKYLVLSDEEKAKGYVRPVRTTYIHKSCGGVTQMGVSIAETYAREPKFYGATYCVHCSKHLPVDEFVWDGTEELVGS
jgi:NAD-dependent deacetylase